MASTTINAKSRTPQKPTGRALRREGQVPGVYYNSMRDVRYVQFDNIALSRLLKTEFGLLDLMVDGESLPCVIREVQRHPVRGNVVHIDLFGVQKDKILRANVSVNIIGVAKGVKTDGGTMDVTTRELEVECLPADLPNHIDVDVSNLAINDSIHLSDLKLEGITFLADLQTVIVHILPPRVQEEVAAAPGAEAVAEPEVITEKKTETD